MTIIKRIAIVGAGPAGLAAAKALALEPAKFTIDLFERRDNIGGVWNFHGDKGNVKPPIPSTDPNGEEKILSGGFSSRFFSSMYKNVETNLTDKLMEYSKVPFQPRTMNFLDRTEVLRYLERYAQTIPQSVNVALETNVLDVDKPNGKKWVVTTENVTSSDKTKGEYDAVVVANGHYEIPFIPDTPGLKEWSEKDPESVSHSKYFVSSADFKGETVLIIGNWASGMDLGTQIGTTAKQVYVSTKDETPQESEYEYVKKTTLVTKYDVTTRLVNTIDGTTIKNIDKIVFCTGYLYTFPFFRNYAPGITNGVSVKNLFKQTFSVEDPSLSFIGLTTFTSPLPLVESQAALVARVWSNRITLPSQKEMRKDYEDEYSRKGDKDFHSLKDCDYTYCNELYDWIVKTGTDKDGLLPLFWDEERIRERQEVSSVKERRTAVVVKHADKLRAEGKEFSFPKK